MSLARTLLGVAPITYLDAYRSKQKNAEVLMPCDLAFHPADQASAEEAKKKEVHELQSVDEINQMIRYFLDRDRVRDALIFIVQCNTGLRISDTLWLRWGELSADYFATKTQKSNFRKHITIYPNQAVREAAELYRMVAGRPCREDDYVFISEGHRSGHTPILDRKSARAPVRQQTIKVQPLRVETVCRLMTTAGVESKLATPERRISTHTARKTHSNAIQGLVQGFDLDDDLLKRAARLQLAQFALAHSKSSTTAEHYQSKRLHQEICSQMNFGLEEIQAYKRRKGLM